MEGSLVSSGMGPTAGLRFSGWSWPGKPRTESPAGSRGGAPAQRPAAAPDSFERRIEEAVSAAQVQHEPKPSTWRNVRARLGQLVDTQKVLGEPAQRFDGDWNTEASRSICQRMVEEQIAHCAAAVSIEHLSDCLALEYERRNPEALPAERRLLPPGTPKKNYYDAENRALLRAVGETDPEAVQKSFKKGGVGALHRVHVVSSAAVGSTLGVAQTLVPEPTTKAVLAGVRVLQQLATNAFIIDSGRRRARNANTEELMPTGKPDAPNRLKNSPEILPASLRTFQLRGVRKLEKLLAALDAAKTPQALRQAKDDLAVAQARNCYLQHFVKNPYKAASEALAVEFRGNERNLYVSYASGAAGYVAGLLGILTPVLVSAPVTGGVSAAAVVLALGLYGAFQASNGPSKDAQAKANRALTALVKTAEFLVGGGGRGDEQRAQAYDTYLAHRKKARWKLPGERTAIKAKARAELLEKLKEIAADEKPGEVYGLRQNWEAFTEYRAARAEVARRLEGRGDEAVSAAQAVLKEEFEAAHAAHFDTQAATDGWKAAMRARFDGARFAVTGRVAQAHKALLDFERDATKGKLRKRGWEEAQMQRRARHETELKRSLLDMFNLELALQRMKPLIEARRSDDAEAIGLAAQALGAVRNTDVHDLFCGDATRQLEALDRAKKLGSVGELQRYTYTNLGGNLLAMAGNTVALGTGMAFSIERAVMAGEGVLLPAKYGDERIAGLTPHTGATLTAPYSAASRAPFKSLEMNPLLKVIARRGDRIDTVAELPRMDQPCLEAGDPAVDRALQALVEQARSAEGVPDSVALATTQETGEGDAAALKIDLQATVPYWKQQYKTSSLKQKLQVHGKQAAYAAKGAAGSLVSPLAQAVAQVPLKATRNTLRQSEALGDQVRERLVGDEVQQLGQNAAKEPRKKPPKETPNPFKTVFDSAKESVKRLAPTGRADEQHMKSLQAMSDDNLEMLLKNPRLKPGVREKAEAMLARRQAARRRRDAVTPTSFVLPPARLPDTSLDLGEIVQAARNNLRCVEAAAEAAQKIRDLQTWNGAPGSGLVEGTIAPTPAFRVTPARREQGLRFFDAEFERMRRLMLLTRSRLAGLGIRVVPNGGQGNDCLIRALLQLATGDHAHNHAERAAVYRAELVREFPQMGPDDMLSADDPAFAWLVARINADTHRSMNVLIVQPGEGGRPVILPANRTGDDDVALLQGPDHYEALTMASASA